MHPSDALAGTPLDMVAVVVSLVQWVSRVKGVGVVSLAWHSPVGVGVSACPVHTV